MISKILYAVFTLLYLPLSVSVLPPNSTVDIYKQVLRVVNGVPAKLGDVPYQVSFKVGNAIYKSFCGGVIIAPSKILSAAHCFTKAESNVCAALLRGRYEDKNLIQAYAVAGNLRNSEPAVPETDSIENGQWRRIVNATFPPSFSFPQDDIAVVFIQFPYDFNAHVNFINPVMTDRNYRGTCLASGYGRTNNNALSDRLLLAHLELMDNKECSYIHQRNMQNFICTSNQLTDVGKGDSGGPLVCTGTDDANEMERGVLVGIVSGKRENNTFFTRVAKFHNFILRNKSRSSLKSFLCTNSFLLQIIYIFVVYIVFI